MQDSIGSTSTKATVKWYMEKENAFAHISVTETSFTVNFVDKSSSVVYSHSITKIVKSTALPSSKPTTESMFNPLLPSRSSSFLVIGLQACLASIALILMSRLASFFRFCGSKVYGACINSENKNSTACVGADDLTGSLKSSQYFANRASVLLRDGKNYVGCDGMEYEDIENEKDETHTSDCTITSNSATEIETDVSHLV